MEAEYKYKNATIRIHGTVDQENLKKATEEFLKKVVYGRKKGEKTK